MDAFNESPGTTPAAAAPAIPTAQQRRLIWTALTALAIAVLLGIAAIIFLGFITFLSWAYPILLPIGLAVIVALVLEPPVAFFEKRGLHRGAASILVCCLAAIGFLIFWAFLLPPLVTESSSFFKNLPATINDGLIKLQASLPSDSTPLLDKPATGIHADTNQPPVEPSEHPNIALPSAITPPETARPETRRSEIEIWLKDNLPSIQQQVQTNLGHVIYASLAPVGQAFGFLLGFGFVPIYVYYFLADQERLAKGWPDYVPLRRSPLRDEVVSVLQEINTSLVAYFRGQIIVAACNGFLTFIGLWIIGIPYSLVLGVITGALSIVPFLGIICSILPALLLGFLSAKGDPTWQWLTPLLVLVVFAIVQMSESMFITPRVQSHSTGLHPLAIILGILVWSMLLPGLLGPVVAVPLTCAAVVLLRRYVWKNPADDEPAKPSAAAPAPSS